MTIWSNNCASHQSNFSIIFTSSFNCASHLTSSFTNCAKTSLKPIFPHVSSSYHQYFSCASNGTFTNCTKSSTFSDRATTSLRRCSRQWHTSTPCAHTSSLSTLVSFVTNFSTSTCASGFGALTFSLVAKGKISVDEMILGKTNFALARNYRMTRIVAFSLSLLPRGSPEERTFQALGMSYKFVWTLRFI